MRCGLAARSTSSNTAAAGLPTRSVAQAGSTTPEAREQARCVDVHLRNDADCASSVADQSPQAWQSSCSLGEGAHATQTDALSLEASPSWSAVEIRKAHHACGPNGSLQGSLVIMTPRGSPLVTTILNILNADRDVADCEPSFVLGHSIGEVASAYLAGCYILMRPLRPATHPWSGSSAAGAMAHVPDDASSSTRNTTSWSSRQAHGIFADEMLRRDTLCPSELVEAWLWPAA